MLNLLEDYIADSVPAGCFTTNPGLTNKVDASGAFRPFFGSTVVFALDDGAKRALAPVQAALHRDIGDLLARPLETDTLHMTLHDLVSGPARTDALVQDMARVQSQVLPLLRAWRKEPALRMRATRIFNLVHTSVVLGLAPAEEESWRQLERMYQALEAVVPLGYGLTPHITLAYYRPGSYSAPDAARLRAALGTAELAVTLPMQALAYQTFSDMNHYQEVT